MIEKGAQSKEAPENSVNEIEDWPQKVKNPEPKLKYIKKGAHFTVNPNAHLDDISDDCEES